MGIKGLMKLLYDNAPNSIRSVEIKTLFGRKVAIDASMSLYQFLISVRIGTGSGGESQLLTSDSGLITSHLTGFFQRTVRMLELGLLPVFCFDGTAPGLKAAESNKRHQRKLDAESKKQELIDTEAPAEEINKYTKRTITITPEQIAETKKLLTLMG